MPCRAETDAIGAWQRELTLRLSKSYPPRPIEQRGTVQVGFVLDRSGKLIWNVVLQSSGIKALDVEALAIVDRAQPFPAPPAEIDDAKLKIVADLNFPSTRDIFKEDAALHAKLRGVCRGC